MKKFLKQEKGVTLISLAAAIIVMGIITTVLMYSIRDTNDTGKLTDLYSDIDNLTNKVSNYYSTYGKIPAKRNATIESEITSVVDFWQDSPVGANDTGKYLLLDLNVLENLTLNYGQEFENVKNANTIGNYRDLYIINENSHNIFYLKGIKVNNKRYYTKQDKDTQKVNLRYVDGIKIPDGYTYLSGNKSTGIIISNGTKQYKYEDGIYKNYVEDGEGDGTTISVDLTEHDERAWSLPYETTTTYKDVNGDICYIPAGFMVSKLDNLNIINGGFVIKKYTPDNEIAEGKTRMDYGDEYVWIKVPSDVLKNVPIGNVNLTEDTMATIKAAYKEVEDALKEYTKDYREEGYEDEYYEGCGLSNQIEYVKLKYKMYKSIKENGGFYVGRYEAGCNVARTSGSDSNTAAQVQATSGIPLSQRDKYPYNFVTVSQAQGLAQAVKGTSLDYNTSLMFGIQWDLICKFIEETGAKSQYEIKTDSTNWGNYKISSFVITSEYAKSNGSDIAKGTTKNSQTEMLLTTAASNHHKCLNIYDFAGNEYEWLFEQQVSRSAPVVRGGCYKSDIAKYVNYYSNDQSKNNLIDYISFRVTLFK